MNKWRNILFLFLVVSSILAAVSYLRLQDFEKSNRMLAEQSVRSGSAEIARVISELRRQIALFADDRRELLNELFDMPSDHEQYDELITDLEKRFPGLFTATLAASDGTPMLKGLDSLVGKGCRRDIQLYVGKLEKHGVYIHGSPQKKPHHFDIMAPFIFPSGEEGVFFVSFYAKSLASILNSIEVPGHNLYLTINKKESLPKVKTGRMVGANEEELYVEVSSAGARDVIKRDLRISNDEILSSMAADHPDGTRWILVDIPDGDLFSSYSQKILLETLVIELVILILSLLLYRQAGRIEVIKEEREKAESASKAKSEFLSVVSHELRTPLNAIIGMSELVMETKLDEEQREYLQISQVASADLLGLIDDVLDYSNLEKGGISLQHSEFIIKDVLNKVINQYEAKAEQKGIHLVTKLDDNIPAIVIGDAKRITQALLKLCDNGVKFTQSGGEIELTVVKQKETSDTVNLCFTVKDSGIGIKDEDLGMLFQVLTQIDGSSTRYHGGIGLGLVMVKKLVELMKGEIHVDSEFGQGSAFHIFLTLNKLPEKV